MLTAPNFLAGRTVAPATRAGHLRSAGIPRSRGSVKRRDRSAAADLYTDKYSSSRDQGYSRADYSGYSRAAPPPPPVQSSSAGPMLQILATALGQSRATLERLQAEEAEIENLIQRERKQVERLEWLLEKVQQDYAYFDSLQRRFEQSTQR